MKNYLSSSLFFFLAVVSLVVLTLNGPTCNSSSSPLTWNVGFLGSDQVPGPKTSKYVPNLFNKSIRVLCNANTSEGFKDSTQARMSHFPDSILPENSGDFSEASPRLTIRSWRSLPAVIMATSGPYYSNTGKTTKTETFKSMNTSLRVSRTIR
ncbi:hypothetical protein Q3G72_034872 [Acer saccharum]|nr:hypothetical protein Q3G72_034872 [Acer saccharum]